MDKPTVYIETTIVSYLTAWLSKDSLRQAQQDLTKEWWKERAPGYQLFTSQFVIDESAAGDATASQQRLEVLSDVQLVEIGDEVPPFADRLLADGALPRKARVDALHVAVTAVTGIEYLLTWNCKHLANAHLWRKIEATCRAAGYQPPTICTPYELMGERP